ncbi:MAG: LicD family protein [Clostridia bacterium]|nr:LicD family protein [Clostridia bacterium]
MAEVSSFRPLQLKELELFKQFRDFCEAHDITYYALGGTLLGAVRHEGFIPWDDDMDLGVPREDYERFLKLCEEEEVPFELHTFRNDPKHYRYFARIEDPSMKVRRTDNQTVEVSNAWVDIFPLDGMPNNKYLREFHKYYVLWRRAAYKFSCFDLGVNVEKANRPLVERLLIKVGMVLPVEKFFRLDRELNKLDRALKRFPYAKSDYLVNAMGAYKFREMFHKQYYGKGRAYPFEDTTVWGPEDYDFVNTQLYGDYMKPPAEADRNHHSSEIL